jgi:hypothetical protein
LMDLSLEIWGKCWFDVITCCICGRWRSRISVITLYHRTVNRSWHIMNINKAKQFKTRQIMYYLCHTLFACLNKQYKSSSTSGSERDYAIASKSPQKALSLVAHSCSPLSIYFNSLQGFIIVLLPVFIHDRASLHGFLWVHIYTCM